ncbi:iron transporter FeoA [Fervidobacterium ngatamarikiense]|uniref:Iron transporter FeoA n=1 Tax=Fervidobacterium pennivorans TaxID=93466 RepID=A0A172T229_FERPE|nr:FeoA family protein [Fervidobacterium pennivorans]ANE41065.1 iron transporter FeoA [Fervidobacterium pennivorans]
MKLSEAPVGAKVMVKDVEESEISPKLRAIGIMPGVTITVVKSAPMGDPRIYKVFNKLISLRQSEASLVEVEILRDSIIPLSSATPGLYKVKQILGGHIIHRRLSKVGITEGSTIRLLGDRRVVTSLGTFHIGFGKLSKILVTSAETQSEQGS